MKEFQERRRLKKFLHSRYAIALLIIICLLMAKGVWGVYDKYEKSKELAQRTSQELSNLQARKTSLDQSMTSLDTQEGKEREIRERFGVVKDGEKMIVIVDDANKDGNGSTSGGKSWWDVFIGFFTGN